jgi:hypothetical protein
MKEALWAGGFSLLVLIVFISCVAAGWPGEPDDCIPTKDLKKQVSLDHTCYCEPFNVQDVVNHKVGIRQPFNTLSNLYALFTGGFLAFTAFKQRRKRLNNHTHYDTPDENRFRNGENCDFYPIAYIVVVIFLGLGSMWFHASIVSWGGSFDQMSMYTLVSFLIAYSIIRLFGDHLHGWELIGFNLAYWGAIIAIYIPCAYYHVDSELVILVSMIPYGILEFFIWLFDWALDPKVKRTPGTFWLYWRYWIIGLSVFGLALLVRGMSDSGGTLCISCSSAFQYHGVWHWLSGIMAVLLYFHFLKARKR